MHLWLYCILVFIVQIKSMSFILGISAFILIVQLLFLKMKILFFSPERLSKKKHDHRFPKNSIKLALEKYNLKLNQIGQLFFMKNLLLNSID